jgi:glucuronoarabinoxylan endo-1,4-beta-xylanase
MTVDGKPLSAATTSVAGTAIVQATFVPTDSAHYWPSIVSTALTVKPASNTAVIDFGAPKQTIRGFGGSAAWYYSKMSDDRLNVLFGTSLADSLGLSILRLRIAPPTGTLPPRRPTPTSGPQSWTTVRPPRHVVPSSLLRRGRLRPA